MNTKQEVPKEEKKLFFNIFFTRYFFNLAGEIFQCTSEGTPQRSNINHGNNKFQIKQTKKYYRERSKTDLKLVSSCIFDNVI